MGTENFTVTKGVLKKYKGDKSVEQIELPEGIIEIGDSVFEGCYNLRTIAIPETVKTIGVRAFAYSGLDYIHIPASVTCISAGAFQRCLCLEKVTFAEKGLMTIGASAFEECYSLERVVLPDTVKDLGERLFKSCFNLAEVKVLKGVTKIPADMFADCCKLTSVIMADTVIEIQSEAFAGCYSLRKLDLPEKLKVIGDWVFLGCTGLEQIMIPKTVTEVGRLYAPLKDKPVLYCIRGSAAEQSAIEYHMQYKNINTRKKVVVDVQ